MFGEIAWTNVLILNYTHVFEIIDIEEVMDYSAFG
jgi:hypothetical protein